MTRLLNVLACLLCAILLTACSESHPVKQTKLSHLTQTAAVRHVWSEDVGHGSEGTATHLQPTADGNILFTAGSSGKVSSIDVQTGEIRWQYNYHLAFTSDIGQDENFLYIGSRAGMIAKVDKDNGQLLWKTQVANTVIGAPFAKDNILLIKTINGTLIALRADSGQPLWSHQQTVPPLILRDASSARFYENNVIAGFANGNLLSFDAQTGETNWAIPLATPQGKTDIERMIDVDASPVINGSTIYAATYQGNLTSLNATNGEVYWRQPLSAYNNLFVTTNDIFASDADSIVWAFDKETGRALWKQTALKYRQLSGPAATGDYVVVGDREGYLHVMAKTDGHFMARIKLNSSGISATPIVVGQTIVVLCNNGELYAYQIG
jgi:outer membrane protein assembly factor BamB